MLEDISRYRQLTHDEAREQIRWPITVYVHLVKIGRVRFDKRMAELVPNAFADKVAERLRMSGITLEHAPSHEYYRVMSYQLRWSETPASENRNFVRDIMPA